MTTPGLIISAPASGAGKTSVTLGLLRALCEDGLVVQPCKSGPDYIDPAFHHAACGRASFNLDSWAMNGALMDAVARQGTDADLIVAEGAMGLFDGAAGRGIAGHGSSADLARHMGWPVLLVLDVAGQAQSAAAIALGFSRFDPEIALAGVILNRVGSARHERMVRTGLEAAGIRVLGVLPRSADIALPRRHLGLVQAMEHPDLDRAISACASLLRAGSDLGEIRAAASALPRPVVTSVPMRPPAQRIAMAQDAAFSFVYPHMLAAWRAAGAEIMPFSPLADEAPAADADMVWLPGGYPELHAGRLAAAGHFLSGLRRHALTRPVHGECGGYMVLGEALIDAEGVVHRMAGLLGLVTSHAERRLHLGYRRAETDAPIGAWAKGTRLRGHEFHYSTIVTQDDPPLARVTDAEGQAVAESGSRRGLVTGSFFHMIAGEP